MKRLSFVCVCLAGIMLSEAGNPLSACPAVAVQSVTSSTTLAMPSTVSVQTLSVPACSLSTVQTLALPMVQVQTLAVPTTIAAPIVVQQVVRQRPVRVRTRTVTRTGFGLGLF